MKIVVRISQYLLIFFIALISLIPFYILLLLALNSPVGTYSQEMRFLPEFYFRNFSEAWKVSKIGLAVLNSFIITAGAVVIIVLFSSSAGYAIARFKNKFNFTVFNILLLCMMIPGIINTVPLYTLMRSIGGINTHWAMTLVCAANALPFSVFLYTGFIKTISREVEESAIIDGCTWFSAFWKVTFHFIKPVTSAVIILAGLGIWNNYAQAIFFLQSMNMRTIPLAISMFFQQYGAKWNMMAAASVIGVMPVVIAFLVFQRYFIKGITAGAVKG